MLRALSKHWRSLQRTQWLAEPSSCAVRLLSAASGIPSADSTGSQVNKETATAAAPSEEVPTIVAVVREASGTTAANKIRKDGVTPSILFSLPGNQSQLLAVDSKEITRLVRQHGRSGFHSQIFNLEVQTEHAPPQSYRVLPRVLHVNAVTDAVENVTFMHMPPERRAVIPVPIQLTGEDLSPGIKRGGWVNTVARTVKVSCPGDAIPPFIEVDVSGMDLNQSLRLGELADMLPEGLQLMAKDMRHPVCKMAGGRRAAAVAE